MENGNVVAWQLLLERADGARRRAGEEFYGSTIGLTFDAMPMPDGTYWVAKMGDKPVGGIFPMIGQDFDGVPENWLSYLAVDDVDAPVRAGIGHRDRAVDAGVLDEIGDVVGNIAA